MRFSLILAVALLICFSVIGARADFDISPRVVGGRITTFGYSDDLAPAPEALTADPVRVFDFAFDNPLNPNFTQDPGIHALATTSGYTASGLPNGAKFSFDILSDLRYWNGTGSVGFGPVPGGETLFLQLGSNLTVGAGPGFYPGYLIGTIGSDGDQGFHEHFASTLQPGAGHSDPADGVYLMAMDLRLFQSDGVTPYPGIATSLPFYVLYDHGSPNGAIDQAVDFVQATLVPEPSSVALTAVGIVPLAVALRRNRRLHTPRLLLAA